MSRSRIDRAALLRRHDPVLDHRSTAVLSIGNGRFAVGADRIGTQQSAIGPDRDLRVNTLAEWGWHSDPGRPDALWSDHLRCYDTPRGPAPFMDLQGPSGPHDDEGTAGWFRANPHKVSLFAVRLRDTRTGTVLTAQRAERAGQHLDLRTGLLTSTSVHAGRPVEVLAAVDPEVDALALRVRGADLQLELVLPYGSQGWDEAARFDRPAAHTTRVRGDRILRRLDDLAYEIAVSGGDPQLASDIGPHVVRITGTGEEQDVVLELLPREVPGVALAEAVAARREPRRLSGAQVRERCARDWSAFWERTGALDLGASADPRAQELERRTVLSRFLQRAHGGRDLPPAETGLLMNSWRGRAHLEMHWWHSAHHALWGDAATLRRQLGFYTAALPAARATARAQHCRGARWPKQIGPDLRESPSDIGPFLLWQQPHPIHLAELCRRAQPDPQRRDLELELIVEESALFLLDVLREDPASGGAGPGLLGIGPPVIGAQERHVAQRARLRDPAFELAYVAWALRVADAWRARRGAADAGELAAAARRIRSPLGPEGRLRTFPDGPPMQRSDHPAHLLAHGMVPPTGTVPEQAAREALLDVLADWEWESTWGWDAPATAMTAARLAEPELAVDVLLRDSPTNRVDAAGHCYQRETLPVYLPANGALLSAVALMAAGWDGGPPQPGLPDAWDARIEGIAPAPGPMG